MGLTPPLTSPLCWQQLRPNPRHFQFLELGKDMVNFNFEAIDKSVRSKNVAIFEVR